MKQVIAVDLDNTLCYNPSNTFDHKELLELEPNTKLIKMLYVLMNKGYKVVIHSARKEADREVTIQWLTEHRVPYNDIVLDKFKADFYIDDRAINYDINDVEVSNYKVQTVLDLR